MCGKIKIYYSPHDITIYFSDQTYRSYEDKGNDPQTKSVDVYRNLSNFFNVKCSEKIEENIPASDSDL